MKPEFTTTFQMKTIRHGESQSIKGKNNKPEAIPPKVKSPHILDKEFQYKFYVCSKMQRKVQTKYTLELYQRYIKTPTKKKKTSQDSYCLKEQTENLEIRN